MSKINAISSFKRMNALAQAAVLTLASLVPIVALMAQPASGAQLTSRFVDLSANQTSEGSGRDGGDAAGQDVTYRVGFTTATGANVGGIVIDFCGGSPITGDACTAITGFDTRHDDGLVLANLTGTTGFTINASESSTNMVVLNNAGAPMINASTAVYFDLGSTGATDGITNPSNTGSFYARILTFATDTAANNYASASPGTFIDDGGVAMSIANELTITARVQEVLQFCVGSTYSGTSIPADDCTDISGTAINMGVVDSGTTTATDNSALFNDGKAMIRTNANNGAVIYYKAEQNSSSGKLKVAGATCSGVDTTDQCFNSAGTTKATITPGTELFGMSLTNLNDDNGGATQNLVCDTQYNGDGSACTGAPTGYAWDDSGNFDTIASSAGSVVKVIDDEMFNIRFAATASPTTPTGLYTVTANFVATATF